MEMMQDVMSSRHFDYEISALLDQHEIARKESMLQVSTVTEESSRSACGVELIVALPSSFSSA